MGRGGSATTVISAACVLVAAGCGGGGPERSERDVDATDVTVPTTIAESPAATSPSNTGPPASSPATTGPTDDEAPTDRQADVEHDMDAVLARDPLVIFNAYPPKPDHITYPLPPGQRDFFELWEPDAPWQTALEHVDVYRLHAFQMRHFLTDDQIVTLVEFLREHEIPLMFETEPLLPPDPDECAHTESYEGPWDLEMAQRLKDLGGRIDAIAIEQPYHYGHKLDTADACRYPLDRVIGEVMEHVAALRELFGDIPVGTIEAIWATPQTEPRDMEVWLDTYEEMSGEPFAFLHIDPNWYWHDWADVAVGIEAVADARDVPFGVLYNGGNESDGLTWMNFMMANAAELEVEHEVTPQHVSFQSWVDWPDHSLPEDDLTALTSGIVRYFGERIELSVDETPEGLAVNATGLDGRPFAGARLRVRREGGGPTIATQSVRGTVPAGATGALVLVRANAEDATPGTADAVLHHVSFTDGAGGPNLVPNGDFTAGTDQWGAYGSGGTVDPVAAGPGRGLRVRAAADQDVFIDGARFTPAAGDEFELTVTYELLGGSPDSVVVSVEFLGVSRANVFLHDLPSELGELVTGSDGTVVIPRETVGAGPVVVGVSTDGDLRHWPATASISIG